MKSKEKEIESVNGIIFLQGSVVFAHHIQLHHLLGFIQ